MRVGIASDHGGFDLKQELIGQLRAAGHEIIDFGANSLSQDDDYPDFVIPLGRAVAAGQIERGVAICGSGVGASVCATKISRCPGRADPRSFLGAAGRRGRSHEHPLHGRPDRRSGSRLGPGSDLSRCPVQPGRSALASAEQGGVPGSRNRHKVGTRCFIMNG